MVISCEENFQQYIHLNILSYQVAKIKIVETTQNKYYYVFNELLPT